MLSVSLLNLIKEQNSGTTNATTRTTTASNMTFLLREPSMDAISIFKRSALRSLSKALADW